MMPAPAQCHEYVEARSGEYITPITCITRGIQSPFRCPVCQTPPLFSDASLPCLECLTEYPAEVLLQGVIHDPGKFEGEHISTYHAWHTFMAGGSDETNGPYILIGNMILHCQDQGFIVGDTWESEEETRAYWARHIEAYCFDQDCVGCDLPHGEG